MLLDIDATLRFFLLLQLNDYAMTYVNPAPNDFSKGFSPKFDGVEVTALREVLCGCILAILCVLLPYPVTARSKVASSARQLVHGINDLEKSVLQYYCSDSQSMAIDELESMKRGMKESI